MPFIVRNQNVKNKKLMKLGSTIDRELCTKQCVKKNSEEATQYESLLMKERVCVCVFLGVKREQKRW